MTIDLFLLLAVLAVLVIGWLEKRQTEKHLREAGQQTLYVHARILAALLAKGGKGG